MDASDGGDLMKKVLLLLLALLLCAPALAAGQPLVMDNADLLTQDACTSAFFDEAQKTSGNAKTSANFIIGEIAAKLKNTEDDLSSLKFTGAQLGGLVLLTDKGEINLNTAKKVLADMFETGEDAAVIVERKGLKQVNDTGAIKQIVVDVVKANPQSVEDIKNGKDKAKYKDVYLITPNASDNHETSVDGTHPDNYGYSLWYRSIEEPVRSILTQYGIN